MIGGVIGGLLSDNPSMLDDKNLAYSQFTISDHSLLLVEALRVLISEAHGVCVGGSTWHGKLSGELQDTQFASLGIVAGWVARDVDEFEQLCGFMTYRTSYSREVWFRAVALSVYLSKKRVDKMDIYQELRELTLCNFIFPLSGQQLTYSKVAKAIYCGLEAKGFENALKNSIKNGDGLSVSAPIAGAIAEARSGVVISGWEAFLEHLALDVDGFFESIVLVYEQLGLEKADSAKNYFQNTYFLAPAKGSLFSKLQWIITRFNYDY